MASKVQGRSGYDVLEKTWERIQQKTFTKWVNSHLRKRGVGIEDLQKDFCDGLKLITFLEIISNKQILKYEKKPKMRVQMIQNLYICLKFIEEQRVKLVAISAEDICDGNLKLILGMIWTIIQKFQIEDISEEEMTAKEALLLWCQKKTHGYSHVKVENFHTSWADGLAFCALIHKHRPDLINYDKLNPADKAGNLKLAFEVADKELNIPQLLDIEDMLDVKPDERSVITYVSAYYHVFAQYGKQEAAGRRVGKLVDLANSLEQMRNDYSSKAKELAEWTQQTTVSLQDRNFDNSLAGIQSSIQEFSDYKTSQKPPKAAQKLDLEALLNSLQLKLKSNNRPPWTPPEGLGPKDLDDYWSKLETAEREREEALRKELERQARLDYLRRRLGLKADKLEAWIENKEVYLATNEAVDSLATAQIKISLLEAFNDEYAGTKAALQQLQQIADEIVALNAPDSAAIKQRTDAITSKWEGLRGKADAKMADLKSKQELQQRMENLRLEYAKQAKNYDRFCKEAANAINQHNFGYTLETVEAYKQQLDHSDQSYNKNSDDAKASLDKLWAEMESLGVTDKKYTVLTDKDIAAMHGNVSDLLKKRHEAYDAELARQRAMENKRKEFAAAAQAFVDSLAQRRAAVDALTGEPKDLVSAIQATYQDGKPETEKLAALSHMLEEMSHMGIKDNKHTEYTIPVLNNFNKQFSNYVRDYIQSLNEEDFLKAEYIEKAKNLISWVNDTLSNRLKEIKFENTLADAQAKNTQWTEYKAVERARNSVLKTAVEDLFTRIGALLQKHNRPPFPTPAGTSPAEINQIWERLEASEKSHEEAIKKELERQQKLQQLVRRFNQHTEDLSTWIAPQQNYLSTEDIVQTLNQAQTRIKLLEAFNQSYAVSKAKVDQLQQLSEEISADNYIDAAQIKHKFTEVAERWSNLSTLADTKKQDLQHKLAEQQKMEDLRIEFANKAKEYEIWTKSQATSINAYSFGDTLEAVKDHKAVLDQSDDKYTAESLNLKQQLDNLWAALESLGVKDNKYTSKTNKDVEATHDHLLEVLKKRQDAYAVELKHQEEMEAKRIEFAQLAQEFVQSLEERRQAINALQGEPEDLIASIQSTYQDGAPESGKLSALQILDQEMKAMGISENKHTEYNLSILRSKNQGFADHVRNKISQLEDEKELKAQYTSQANSLAQWIQQTAPALQEKTFDNTLAGIQAQSHSWTEYKTTVRAEKAIEKLNIENLFNKIVNFLKTNSRPEFPVPAGLTVADINAQWQTLEAEEKAREEAILKELERQEKLAQLARKFAFGAEEIESWIGSKQPYLTTKDQVDSLESARLKKLLLDIFNEEYVAQQGGLDALQKVQQEISQMGYIEADQVNNRIEKVADDLANFQELSDNKGADIKQSLQSEEKKENLRSDFAQKTKDLRSFIISTTQAIADTIFPSTLDSILAYKAELEQNDSVVTAKANDLKTALDNVHADLGASGVANIHNDQAAGLIGQLNDALTKRRNNYETEVKRLTENEELCKLFAQKAQEFVDYIQARRGEIEQLSGEPEDKIAHLDKIYQKGAPAKEFFGNLQQLDSQIQARGIHSNPHTSFTLQILSSISHGYDSFYEVFLTSLNDEKAIKEKSIAQEEANKKQAEINALKIDLLKKVQELNQWLDIAEETLTDPIKADTVEEAQSLHATFEAVIKQLPEKAGLHKTINDVANQLGKATLDVNVDALNQKWDATNVLADTRRQALTSELGKQQENETLRVEFANKGKAFEAWIKDRQAAINKDLEGDLQGQLQALRQLTAGLQSGKNTIQELEAVNQKLLDRGVLSNKHTDLTLPYLKVQFNQLLETGHKKEKLIEGEVLAKTGSNISSEQMNEFKEMFDHFDKDKSGTLKLLEFKGMLRSLGEDLAEKEIEALFKELASTGAGIPFDSFVNYMTKKSRDTVTKDEILESFKSLAGEKDFITEDDMRRALPGDKVDYLVRVMPKYASVPNGYDYKQWANAAFN